VVEMQVDDSPVISADRTSTAAFGDQDLLDLLVAPRDRLPQAALAVPPKPTIAGGVVGELHLPVVGTVPDLDGPRARLRRGSPAIREQRLECLDSCLQALRQDQRELAIDYYRDAGQQKIERRREIAARMGISMNALGIRACRIRNTLEACVETCCAKP